MQQAVYTTQIHKSAVIGDVLDNTLDDRTFRQICKQRLAIGSLTLFQNGAARHHYIVALAIKFDDLELHFLIFVRRGVLDRTNIHQRTRQKGANAVNHGGQTAFDFTAYQAAHNSAAFHRSFQVMPSCQALRLIP